jgi:oxygen-independent coproporphyrinogen-3 oxidase
MALSPELIRSYNIPAPRYTSYPTVPAWENNVSDSNWDMLVKKAFQTYGNTEGITLYIHFPFCESLCTYCGCNKRITKNHGVESPYAAALIQEWNKYLVLFDQKPKIAGIHLGGGTPTFFSPASLHEILSTIIHAADVLPEAECSFEGHPNNTSFEHLQTLAKLGFDRVSYGIQDFDLSVQQSIHRIQPFERVQEATLNARKLGYASINFDLIYGLPHQTQESLSETFGKVASLAPDRIAFYSYAHLPSVFPAQKSFEAHLPDEQEKRALYELGKKLLLQQGYEEVGMDHFALPSDPLCLAKKNGNLHRNFMGYTTSPSKILLGLGVSSISDIYLAYGQNTKTIEEYQNQLKNGHWPIQKGHIQTDQDIQTRQVILDLICNQKAKIPKTLQEKLSPDQLASLLQMENDELLHWDEDTLQVTDQGVALVRNICMQVDLRLAQNQSKKYNFSKAI